MPTYSYSQLETFDNCPLKYKFKYIDKIRKPEAQSIEAFVGITVHEVLRKLYADLVLGKRQSIEELLGHYGSVWRRDWMPTIRIVQPDLSAENYFDYGARCLRNYYQRHAPFDQSQTLDLEAQVAFALDSNGAFKLQGYIDRIARRPDGTYEIHDYKSSQRLSSQPEVDSDRQLGLYQLGLRSLWRDVERVELIWHFVGKDTTLSSTRTPEQLAELSTETIERIKAIQSAREFEPRQSALCNWCEYRPDCPLWRHVDAAEALSAAGFAADAGVRLANEYAQTKLEMDRLADRLESLREALVGFAKEKQTRVLRGSGVKVWVTIEEKTKFPDSKEPLRRELEQLVKEAGRWEEVSTLSVTELAKGFEDERWPPSFLERLRSFARTEESATVRVTRPQKPEESRD